jgi:precorrin-2 dehydrogenase/sirohydrochlorin ferrochelatase
MSYYPIFLDLTDRTCVVVGAGDVGQRKIRTLLQCGVKKIFVYDPYSELPDDLASKAHSLEFKKRQVKPEDLDGADLVFVCTNDKELNRFIALQCKKKNIFCNVATSPLESDFILPSIFTRGDLCLAISTGGHSPALARKIRLELEKVFGPEYELLTRLLSKIRPLVLSLGRKQQENAEIFRSLVFSELLQALRLRDQRKTEEILKQLLPEDLHAWIGGLIDELFESI